MEIASLIMNFLALLGVGVIALLVKSYLTAYTGEKAKNLATKEDIADITKKIEEVRSQYAQELENTKINLQIESSLKQAFLGKCLEAIEAVNKLLIDITLYCWKELSERSPNEHYVWRVVDQSDKKWNFHYFRVAIDKINLQNALYLTPDARQELSTLSKKIGLLSSMELVLSSEDPHPEVVESAESGYRSALDAVEVCRDSIMLEMGLTSIKKKESKS